MRVVLIGNYGPDRQESMIRYANLVREALSDAHYQVTLVAPRPVLNRSGHGPRGIWKWIGYADKYWLGTRNVSRAVAAADVVHVCDHSNAIYIPSVPAVPYVVSCHDLLAVRGALGEETDCPASPIGRQLQLAILRGLRRARALACGSRATLRDAQRLLAGYTGRLTLGTYALAYSYKRLDRAVSHSRLSALPSLAGGRPYVLHVGSNLRRKNREIVVRAVASIAGAWSGRAVFAGEPLDADLRALAEQLGIGDRIVDVRSPTNELLEALYSAALALVFPSRFEGFGWPVIEAQACECPVICSDRDPLPDVAGGAAIICDVNDAAAFGQAILQLAGSEGRRGELVGRGKANAALYTRAEIVRRFAHLYEQVTGRV
jgi:glycosyltransferase involved in cell wall biosynthesis